MKIAFYGSSLLSSYWNGAATYYRGLLRALAQIGHDITFYEPDILGRQQHRDIDPPSWCSVVVYEANPQSLVAVARQAGEADVVVKASGVGYEDEALLLEVLRHRRPDSLAIFWDVDAPATLAQLQQEPDHPLHRAFGKLDLVLTYGGGTMVSEAYRALGARDCIPVYNALDPHSHHPAAPDSRFAAELGFLGNRLPDREERVREFFFAPAAILSDSSFVLGGSGWDDSERPANIRYVGHVGTCHHNAFNASAKAVLNVSRESMARNGFSPATRIFEAAGAGACLISDTWPGVEEFLKPDREILLARDGRDVAEILAGLTPAKARLIGDAALQRVLDEHTYLRRATLADGIFRHFIGRNFMRAAE
ncbi:MAG: CgeB family protein [Pseudomonadota bacterium]